MAIEGSSEFANGYDVKIAKKIAAALNLKLRIVKSDWDSLIPAVQSGTVDCVIAGQSIKPERLQNVDFTKPYYYADIVTLTLKDSKFAKATSPADFGSGGCSCYRYSDGESGFAGLSSTDHAKI